jgi:hypothetical protein
MATSPRARFPDCIASRKIGEGRWQELRIEFEFESKTFRAHCHDSSGVDAIVCRKHNWPQCPKHIEIIELSSLVQNLEALSRAIRAKRKPLSAWRAFSRKHRLAGRSFAEISKLWREQKR